MFVRQIIGLSAFYQIALYPTRSLLQEMTRGGVTMTQHDTCIGIVVTNAHNGFLMWLIGLVVRHFRHKHITLKKSCGSNGVTILYSLYITHKFDSNPILCSGVKRGPVVITGMIPGLRPVNERRRYKETQSLSLSIQKIPSLRWNNDLGPISI